MLKKRVADIVVETLIENGIDTAFSVVGGGAMHLNNAFALKRATLHTVYNHHEQASAMAAESYARLTGKLAAVCVTAGPGAINTYNGVQGAWVDSLPMIVIAGHPRYETTIEACGLDVRCIGVQETNAVDQVQYFTKYAKLIKDPLEVKREISKAIKIAMDGRRGPVWLSIPLNVQGAQVEEADLYDVEEYVSEVPSINQEDVRLTIEELKAADRPIILSGSGIRSGAAVDEFRILIEKWGIPVVGGYGAPDVCYDGEKNYYGMSGVLGSRVGNLIIQNSDYILVLGNSLSSSQTGFSNDLFALGAKLVMVDAQPDEAKKSGLSVSRFVHADVKSFIKELIKVRDIPESPEEWKIYCESIKQKIPKFEVLEIIDDRQEVHPVQFWKYFLSKAEKNAIIAMGNSSSVHGVLCEGVAKEEQHVLVNYHSGSMGTDIPFAEGACEGRGEAPVYCITGDGCFMMNLQELQTIKYNKYPVKLVVFNNNGYDNIRNTCRNFFEGLGNGCDETSGISMPDFGKVADTFEMNYRKLSNVLELEEAVDWFVSQKTSCFLEIVEKQDKERAPIIKSVMDSNGKFVTPALHVMWPPLDEEIYKQCTKYIQE